ncbi:hypothetical protein NicSoilC12_14040 [Arthrobacter sp. NicSoilC12]|nr:hypothetical protein NicSoilC12_14040 [Arthrobacter sp. NicSoilC12]
MKASPSKCRTSGASVRSEVDPLGFITRNKIPTVQSWRTTDLTPASKIQLRPGEGFGIDCEHNGIVVIDPDTPAALKAFADLLEGHEGTRRLRTYAVKTPRGHHFYFRAIDGVVIRNSVSKLAPNLDVRGVGGFVNAPPTPGYEVLLNVPPRDLPEWLVAMLVTAEPQKAPTDGVTGTENHSLGGITFKLANAQEGTRNDVLHWCVCRAAEMTPRKQKSALRAIRHEARMIGLDDQEIEKTVSSVFGGRRG